MSTELGVGYISIVPEVSKISPGIAKALESTQSAADKHGQRLGVKLSTGISKTLKAGALATGASVGGLLSGAIAKGMGRLTAIEGAQAKLTGLGNDAKTVAGVMDNALASVKGTAHGLGEAASTAASMVASGIKPGQELEGVLKTVGDTAAIAGRSMKDVGVIFGSVAARGKLQGDDMLQLMQAGIPVLQLVAKELGVTSAEVSDMVTKGKVDFATFEKAMRNGVGGVALETGNTAQGAMANFGAALGRVGATGLRPFFDLSKDGFNAATKAIDSLDAKLKPVATGVAEFLQKKAVPAVKDAGKAFAALGKHEGVSTRLSAAKDAFVAVVDAGKKLAPIVVEITTSLSRAASALGISAWDMFVNALQVAASVTEALAGPLATVSGFMKDHPALVTAAVAAWAGFKTLPTVTGKMSSALQRLNDRVGGTTDGLHQMRPAFSKLKAWSDDTGAGLTRLDVAMQAVGDRGTGVMQSMARSYTQAATPLREVSVGYKNLAKEAKNSAVTSKDAFTSFDFMAQHAGRSVQKSVTGMAATVKGVGAASLIGLKSAATGVMGLFGGPWGLALAAASTTVMGVVTAVAQAKETKQALAGATRDAAQAQLELGSALAGTKGELGEGGLAAATKLATAHLTEFTAVGKQMQTTWNPTTWFKVDPLVSFGDRLKMTSQQYQEHLAHLGRTKAGYKALDKALKTTGLAHEDVGRVVAQGGADYNKLRAELLSLGDSGKVAADKLAENRTQVLESIEAARALDPAVAHTAESMGVLANTSSTASDKLAALQKIMEELTGGALSKDAAQAKLVEDVEKTAESISKLSEKFAHLGSISLDPDGTIDATTKAGAEAVGVVEDLSKTMLEASANGIGANEVFSQQESNLTALKTVLGLTDEQFNNMLQSYGLTRELMDLPMRLEGADTAAQQIEAISLGLHGLPEDKPIQIQPPDPAVVVALEQIGFKVEHLPNGNVQITSDADTQKDKLKDLGKIVTAIDGSHAVITADLNDAPFVLKAEQAQQLGRELDGLKVSPEADLVIEKLLQGKEISVGELELLSKEKALPIADLEKKLFDSGVDDANKRLGELGLKTSKPKISIDPNPALNAIEAVLNGLSKLPGMSAISIPARVASSALSWVRGRSEGGLAGFAAGGRLPVYGPGTDRVDGILGVGSDGMPVARVDAGEWVINRRSSEKYHDILTQINAGTFPAYAAGGLIKSADEIKKAVQFMHGTPYLMGGWSPAATDCSGAVSGTINVALGAPFFDSRMSTVTEGAWLDARGAVPGRGGAGDISVGWWDQGGGANGHTALRLQDGTFIESGGHTGSGFTIGGKAGPLDGRGFTQWRHFPGGDDSIAAPELSRGLDITTGNNSRGDADFGKAGDLYRQELARIKRGYASGGKLPVTGKGTERTDGFVGVDAAGVPIARVDAGEWVINRKSSKRYDGLLRQINAGTLPGFATGGVLGGVAAYIPPHVIAQIAQAGKDFEQGSKAFGLSLDKFQADVLDHSRGVGGDLLGNTEIVRDAQRGLEQLKAQFASEYDAIANAQKERDEVLRQLEKSERDAVHRLADREAALAKARKGDKKGRVNAEAVAKAERDLAKAREDAPEKTRKLAEKLAQADEKIEKARDKVADQSERLLAAERAVAAARLKAAQELVTSVATGLEQGFVGLGNFFNEMARLAGIVDKNRQAVSKLEMQQQTGVMERIKTLQDLQLKEWDIQRARVAGAVSVAQAEAELEKAREQAGVLGATSIEAMRGAMDRFYRTGIFAVDEITAHTEEGAKLIRAAEWGVQKAKIQNALDLLEATNAQKLAQFAVLEATLKQATAVKLMQAHTEALKLQTAQLGGMTANQAAGAASGFGGIGKILGGLGKVVGGALLGVFGGPAGIAAGLAMAGSGIADAVKGGVDVHHNKAEMGKAWQGLSTGSKVGVILGGAAGAATALGGAAASQHFGADVGRAGVDAGSQIINASLGAIGHSITTRVEKIQRDLEDKVNAIQRDADQKNLESQLQQAAQRVKYLGDKDQLSAELEYAKLRQEMEKTDSARVRAALEAAANMEKLRATSEKNGHIQTGELQKMNRTLEELLKELKAKPDVAKAMGVQGTHRLVGALSAVDSRAYDQARL